MKFIETHFHLLPGIDDGPSSMDESVALARAAVADGTRIVVATPHVHRAHVTDPTELGAQVRELDQALRDETIPLEVRTGGEIAHHMVERLTDTQLDSIAHGPAGKRWVLLEAPFDGLRGDYSAAADELRARGFAVLVGHPERAAPTPMTAAALNRELKAGSILQLTACSFLGWYGEEARDVAFELLRRTDRVLIASDAHGRDRMPALRPAIEELRAAGERDAARYVSSAPHSLLEHGLNRPPSAIAA